MDSWLAQGFNRSQLPNDVEKLKDIIDHLYQQNLLLQKQMAELQQQNAQLQQQVEDLKNQIALLKKDKFGKKSEKIQPRNGSRGSRSSSKTEDPPKKHPGRQALPEHLPRVRVEHDLAEEEKICPLCQSRLTLIQEVKTEQLDVVPAQLQVKEHVRFKYACRHCYGYIKMAEMPAQAIDKGIASASLMAQVLTNKFNDHLPFYRQQRWFNQQQCAISRSTLWGWEKQCAIALAPLVDCSKQELIQGDHLFSDDTTMPTLEKGQPKAKVGRMWVYARRPTASQRAITVYEYTPDRKGEHPQSFLKDFKGFLQVDAYSGLDALFAEDAEGKQKIKEVGCWAHVRRKFVDVTTLDPTSIAQELLILIQGMYAVERLARQAGYSDEQRKWLRRKRSKPLLKKIHRWLITNQPRAAPKSTLGQAINYALNHWRALTTFLGDGRLEIDNNRSERAIKPIVIGRKNFLFMGGPKGGWAAAIIFSLMESCKQNGVNPYHYLADVLERIPTHPNKRIHALLPHHWQPESSLHLAA
jgi:transposase